MKKEMSNFRGHFRSNDKGIAFPGVFLFVLILLHEAAFLPPSLGGRVLRLPLRRKLFSTIS